MSLYLFFDSLQHHISVIYLSSESTQQKRAQSASYFFSTHYY